MTARQRQTPAASADLARLLLRAYLGAELIARRGCPHHDDQHVITTAAAVALIAGAATPLAAAASASLACAIPSIHHPNGLGANTTPPATQLANPLATAFATSVAAIVIAALGPGKWSLDHLLTRHRYRYRARPGTITAGLTAAAALAHLARSWPAPDTP
jgi:putative oxidoreductase